MSGSRDATRFLSLVAAPTAMNSYLLVRGHEKERMPAKSLSRSTQTMCRAFTRKRPQRLYYKDLDRHANSLHMHWPVLSLCM